MKQSNANNHCMICNSNQVTYCKHVKDSKTFLPGTWALKKCNTCSVYFLVSPPDSNSMGYYYKNYYTHFNPPNDSRIISTIYNYHYKKDKSLLAAITYHVLKKHINLFPQKITDKPLLLDFGSGNGHLMLRFQKYGFNCFGFDVDPVCVKRARSYGLNVFSGDFFSFDFEDKFDVIILNQSLEHLHDPLKYLNHIHALLKDSGQLIISVPNSNCLDFHILKDSWSSFQAPTHLFHFNKKSLTYLLTKVGFSVEAFSFSSSLNTMKPRYLKNNLQNVLALEKNAFYSAGKSFLFIATSFLSLLPFFNQLKKIRITAYCKKTR